MREGKVNGRYTYNINPDFLKLLLKYQNENEQVRFILEAAGYEYLQETLNKTNVKEETGKVKKYFKSMFKKVV